MAKYSRIEWTDATWSPVTGCTPISEGCQNCYAKRMANRLRGRCGYPQDDPFRVTLHEDRLGEPLRWKQPRRVFVCSMGDLFHEDVPDEFIYEIWDVMVQSKQHTFLVLTKRPDRMKSFIEKVMCNRTDYALTFRDTPEGKKARKWAQEPVQNVWLGVTAENQRRADERIPILLQIPAAVRFVSIEPMLGPIDLTKLIIPITGPGSSQPCAPETWRQINALTGDDYQYDWKWHGVGHQGPQLNWVICGGETGPGARPMHPDWVRSLRDQCQAAEVPFFFKQHGEWVHETQGIDFHEGHKYYVWPDESMSFRVGKKAASRILDGRTWDEMPEI